jgi:hypothetical protein
MLGAPFCFEIMTDLEISNVALARIGEARITDFNGTDMVSEQCRVQLPLAIDEVLRSHRWNFAQTRIQLEAEVNDDDDELIVPAFGFEMQFPLPSDCLRVLEVNGISGSGDPSSQWEIEGRKLLCSLGTPINVVYIKQQSAAAFTDSLALECLVLLLAAKLSPTIQGGSTSKADELRAELTRVMAPIARRIDSNESRRQSDNMMVQMMDGSHALQARRGWA